MIPGVLGGNSLLQGNGIDRMGLGVSKSWGKVPAACAGHSIRGRIAECNLGCLHSLVWTNNWKFRFSPFWSQKSPNVMRLPFLYYKLIL